MQYTYEPWYFFGRDFSFKNADSNFNFIEEVMVNFEDMNISLFSDYLKGTDKFNKKLKQYNKDFFVYEEKNGDTWSGFYSNKPHLKHAIRELHHSVRSLRMFLALNVQQIEDVDSIMDIVEDSIIFLHHDAITGTAKRIVDHDYLKRIREQQKKVTAVFEDYLNIDLDLHNTLMNLINNEVSNPQNFSYINFYNPNNYKYSGITYFTYKDVETISLID